MIPLQLREQEQIDQAFLMQQGKLHQQKSVEKTGEFSVILSSNMRIMALAVL